MSNIVEFVRQQEPLFCGALTDQSVTWTKESQFAIQYFQKSDSLSKAAAGNPSSAQNAIINVAAIGITLNPASKLAYLVPRDGMVCLDISYMGLLHLAQSTGSIKWGQCKLVYANDTYESNGLDCAPTHKYNAFGNRGEVVGGYCTVKTVDGDYLTEEMTLADIEAVKATSKMQNGPWKKFWAEMARKTIVKRASKYWPRRERLDAAINYLNTEGGEGFTPQCSPERDVTPAETTIIKEINDVLTAMDKTWDDDLLPLCSKIFRREILESSDLTHAEAVKALGFLKQRAAA